MTLFLAIAAFTLGFEICWQLMKPRPLKKRQSEDLEQYIKAELVREWADQSAEDRKMRETLIREGRKAEL